MYPVGYNPDSFVCNPGERYKPEYVGVPDEYGEIHLEKVGEIDLVEFHNRDADLNDVNILYERFCSGDVTALPQIQGSFYDGIGLPKDLREMYETVNRFEQAYLSLPDEKRKQYSFEDFLDNAGSETWINNFVTQNINNSENEPDSKE